MRKTITLGGLKREDFQNQIENKTVDLFILSNKNGLEMAVTNYGAKIVTLHVPDKNGHLVDVVLGHNNIDEYLNSPEPYYGAICGRVANRIAKGKFTLDGKEYTLAVNNGPNHLHGGLKGFNAAVWDAKQIDNQTIELTYLSKDGEEGYPGNLSVKVVYSLTDENAVEITYQAQTDQSTILNITNHSFFNLSGAGNPSIEEHSLTVNADTYLPIDETAIPLGNPESVEGTPMDFRTEYKIGSRIEENFQQLINGRGYDHTYILNKKGDELSFCAKATSPDTGISMEVYTTEPGVQLYSGNWLAGDYVVKGGGCYPMRSAFCLETQHYPDSANRPEYPSVVLKPGETFNSKTIFKF